MCVFDEPVFVLYSSITAKFGERQNSLLKFFDVHVEQI